MGGWACLSPQIKLRSCLSAHAHVRRASPITKFTTGISRAPSPILVQYSRPQLVAAPPAPVHALGNKENELCGVHGCTRNGQRRIFFALIGRGYSHEARYKNNYAFFFFFNPVIRPNSYNNCSPRSPGLWCGRAVTARVVVAAVVVHTWR